SVGTMRRDVMPKTRFYLRRQGRTYTNFFVTAPICCPSRATIMTGRYNHNNGVTGNTRERFRLDFDSTLQHYLSEAGYQTWISGKFLNAWSIRYAGRPPAWDRYTITRGGSHHNTWFRHGQGDGPGRRFMYRPYADQLIERQALRYVRRTEESDAQPWFGFLSLTIPHGPPIAMDHYADLRFAARRPNRAERERSIADKWPGYAEHGIQGNPRFISKAWIVQLQMLRHADDVIGRVMAQLGDQNELENTIVVFLSDNGYMFGAHRLKGKRLPYTESIKVPALIRWTKHIQPGSVDMRFTANVDLAPTLLHAAGVTPDPAFPLDGRDLFDPSWERDYILTEHWKEASRTTGRWRPGWASLRSRDWQYIEYFSNGRTVFREYYDLRRDPAQLQNRLARRQTDAGPRIAKLHALLTQARTCVAEACP
ncbi:MAG: hypothetical protein QOF68_997, partial [Gaiellales bacterium]|nr:hypothetical protein [Gaiellales bacterium]